MTTAVIVGGSVAGLASALALSELGYRVTVLERSPAPPPASAASEAETAAAWRRTTVPQERQAHTLTSLGVRVLRERAPQVLARALAAGAVEFDLTRALPDAATDAAREPGDDELVALGVRRSLLDLALHRQASGRPGVAIRHGVTVDALDLAEDGRRVRAVVTRGGGRVPADIIVDATGRLALSRTWLRGSGIRLAEDLTGASGLTSHTRFYRLRGGSSGRTTRTAPDLPSPLEPVLGAVDGRACCSAAVHPGDNGTFAVSLGALPGDRALSGLTSAAGFESAAGVCPGLGRWLAPDVSEPLSPVHTMTSPANALWGPASSRQFPVAGLFQVGDAACVTGPLFARGASLALAHAYRLADVLAEYPEVNTVQRRAVARMTEELFLPWYAQSVASDRSRISRWRAAVDNTPAWGGSTPHGCLPTLEEAAAAARHDGTVWRGLTRVLMTLSTPAEVLCDEKFRTRVRAALETPDDRPAPPARTALVQRVLTAQAAAA